MIKQLSTGKLVDVSNIENMYELFNYEQFEIIEAYIEYQHNEQLKLIEELDEVNDILNEKEKAVSDLTKYVKRYGLKNETKVLDKLKNI